MEAIRIAMNEPVTIHILMALGVFTIVTLIGIVAWFIKADKQRTQSDMSHLHQRVDGQSVQFREQISRIERDVHTIKEQLPMNYVSKLDFAEFKGWLQGVVLKIESKLDADRVTR